jgi:sugar phosphate isomerase/epimerase
MFTRRQFLVSTSAAAAGGMLALDGRRALANPLGLPLGLQLYSVREMLGKDYVGTLQQLASLGYREVEAAGFFGRSPSEVKAAMTTARLSCVSSHHPAFELSKSADEIIPFCRDLGAKYVICSFPGIMNPSRLKDGSIRTLLQSFTMADYRWNAERFNEWGHKVKAAGMQFGYHNHTMEFAAIEGVIPMKELLRLTDPELVTFELDCGWVTVGSGDPVGYLREYANRISMLHVKDFKPTSQPASVLDPPPAAELGQGTVNFRAIFAAAKGGSIRHAFVEQEAYDIPPLKALRIDAQYMKALQI